MDQRPVSALNALIVRSFAGGELAPSLAARADLAKYTIGLRTCRNFVVQRHGGVANRAGTRFINNCRDHSGNVQLVPYVSEIAGQMTFGPSTPIAVKGGLSTLFPAGLL